MRAVGRLRHLSRVSPNDVVRTAFLNLTAVQQRFFTTLAHRRFASRNACQSITPRTPAQTRPAALAMPELGPWSNDIVPRTVRSSTPAARRAYRTDRHTADRESVGIAERPCATVLLAQSRRWRSWDEELPDERLARTCRVLNGSCCVDRPPPAPAQRTHLPPGGAARGVNSSALGTCTLRPDHLVGNSFAVRPHHVTT